jgi:hypothetical protein
MREVRQKSAAAGKVSGILETTDIPVRSCENPGVAVTEDNSTDPWLEKTLQVVRDEVNAFVLRFARHPYRHRVEHSLHAELFEVIAIGLGAGFADEPQVRIDAGMPGRAYLTTPVHKEWPLFVGRKRRGNVDLAILTPQHLEGLTIANFHNGLTPADIGVEVGLDYDFGHLRRDSEKLERSGLRNWFLVHLDRKRHRQRTVEELENFVRQNSRADSLAYAWHNPVVDSSRYKLLGGSEICSFEHVS